VSNPLSAGAAIKEHPAEFSSAQLTNQVRRAGTISGGSQLKLADSPSKVTSSRAIKAGRKFAMKPSLVLSVKVRASRFKSNISTGRRMASAF